ncbi:unnamed protein product [Adineta steineri]|uniref:EF-hand domain-containing protein n=1 Tax=Adineta steineri TaxID=433720 RepID=A0A815SQB7_9BILA|nr:unnamed protein product [Adineta steineri]CAF4015017.1 unnamed protein product [Adineta steineri]
MFTLLPSLYFIGVRYFRTWKSVDKYEHDDKEIFKYINKNIQISYDQQSVCSETSEISELVSDVDSNLNFKVKSRKKKLNHRRRKISTNELSHDDIMYLIKKTGFSREEIITWYEDFLHDCPDGKLPKSKVIDVYQKFYTKGNVEKFCDHAFRLFNKDGSGYMDFMEYLFAVSLNSSKDPVRKLQLFFAMYDMDHNGLIDENEMRSAIQSIYELMNVDISDPSRIDTKVYELFSKANCDQLGYLGKDQFAIACQNDRYIRKFLKPK